MYICILRLMEYVSRESVAPINGICDCDCVCALGLCINIINIFVYIYIIYIYIAGVSNLTWNIRGAQSPMDVDHDDDEARRYARRDCIILILLTLLIVLKIYGSLSWLCLKYKAALLHALISPRTAFDILSPHRTTHKTYDDVFGFVVGEKYNT